jgi:hypothetical protein
MPGLDVMLADFKTVLISGIAPYQPDLPPTYPNSDPRAGGIVSTIVGTGHPIQFHVLARLENGLGQIGVYDSGPGKPMPYVNQVKASFTSPIISGAGTITYELGRSIQQVVVEVWASSHKYRRDISDVVRVFLGDYYRITHDDGTVTLLRYTSLKDWDQDQVDSIYVRRLYYMADYVETATYAVQEVTTPETNITVGPVPSPTEDLYIVP